MERLIMGMPLTVETVQHRFGKADEPTEAEQAAMAGADDPMPLTMEQYAEVLMIMQRHGALQPDPETDGTSEIPDGPVNGVAMGAKSS
jgi:hypothetical protein